MTAVCKAWPNQLLTLESKTLQLYLTIVLESSVITYMLLNSMPGLVSVIAR